MNFKNAVNDSDVFKGHCKDGLKALMPLGGTTV